MVSKRDSDLNDTIREKLNSLNQPVELKVFVTTTLLYCPQFVVQAHPMAMENPAIQAVIVQANEFFKLAMRYNVKYDPQTVINNGAGLVLGAVSDEYLYQDITHVTNS